MQRKNKLLLLPGLFCMLFIFSCAILPVPPDPQATAVPTVNKQEAGRSPRLALWLAKKNELLSQNNATFDLVMTGWLEPSESEALRARYPGTNL